MSTNKEKAERSERMKRAWETRRKNLKKAYGAGPLKEEIPREPIKLQLPSQAVVAQVASIIQKEFFEYIMFAKSHMDSGVLKSEKFNTLERLVREEMGCR